MCVRDYEYQVPFGVVRGDGNRIISMTEKPIHHFCNAGIYVLNPEVIDPVSAGVKIDMPTLLQHRISEKQNVMMFLYANTGWTWSLG